MAEPVDRNKPLLQYGGLNTLLLMLESYLEISRIAGSESEMGSQVLKRFGRLGSTCKSILTRLHGRLCFYALGRYGPCIISPNLQP